MSPPVVSQAQSASCRLYPFDAAQGTLAGDDAGSKMPIARPKFTRPGQLSEAEIRDMWRLRTSIYRLKPDIEPERDFTSFRAFAIDAHVGRMLGSRDEVLAMFGYQPIDGEHAGQRYRLALFEYGYAAPHLRSDPLTSAMYAITILSSCSLRRGVVSYFGGIGYPRSVMVIGSVIPKLRFDGDPDMSALERVLTTMVIERLAGPAYDPQRRIVSLPTLPVPLSASWLARHGSDPRYLDYIARVPDWQQGRGLVVLGCMQGAAAAVASELWRRVWRRVRALKPT